MCNWIVHYFFSELETYIGPDHLFFQPPAGPQLHREKALHLVFLDSRFCVFDFAAHFNSLEIWDTSFCMYVWLVPVCLHSDASGNS